MDINKDAVNGPGSWAHTGSGLAGQAARVGGGALKVVGIVLLVYVVGMAIFVLSRYSTTKSTLLSYGWTDATSSLLAWTVMLIATAVPALAIVRIVFLRGRAYDYAAAMLFPLISWGMAQIPANFNASTGAALKFCASRPDNSLFCLDHAGVDPLTQKKLVPMDTALADLEYRRSKGLVPERILKPVADVVFFDPLSAQPKVWVHKNERGCFDMFNNPGADPQSGEQLIPATKEIVRQLRQCSTADAAAATRSIAAAASVSRLGAALVFDPPSNVRRSPNGPILCSIQTQRTISIGPNQGGWYSTDVCGSPGVIAQSQLRF